MSDNNTLIAGQRLNGSICPFCGDFLILENITRPGEAFCPKSMTWFSISTPCEGKPIAILSDVNNEKGVVTFQSLRDPYFEHESYNS